MQVGVLMQSLTGIMADVAAFCGIFVTFMLGCYMYIVGMMPDNALTKGHTANLSIKMAAWAIVGEYFEADGPWNQVAVLLLIFPWLPPHQSLGPRLINHWPRLTLPWPLPPLTLPWPLPSPSLGPSPHPPMSYGDRWSSSGSMPSPCKCSSSTCSSR